MKKVPVFIFLLIFAVMLTACGIEDVSPLPEEENTPENDEETESDQGGLIRKGENRMVEFVKIKSPVPVCATFLHNVWHKPHIVVNWCCEG